MRNFIPRDGLVSTVSFAIHNNGGRPFRVVASNQNVSIHKMAYDHIMLVQYIETDLYQFDNFAGIWVGIDNGYNFHGNSVLIELCEKRYIFVGGHQIYEFETDTRVVEYMSPVGNSDVPYPYAITENKAYLMLEHKCVDLGDIAGREPYSVLYDITSTMSCVNYINAQMTLKMQDLAYDTKIDDKDVKSVYRYWQPDGKLYFDEDMYYRYRMNKYGVDASYFDEYKKFTKFEYKQMVQNA